MRLHSKVSRPIKCLLAGIFLIDKKTVDSKLQNWKFVSCLGYIMVMAVILLFMMAGIVGVLWNKWLALSFTEPCLVWCSFIVIFGLIFTFIMLWMIPRGMCKDKQSFMQFKNLYGARTGIFLAGLGTGISIFLLYSSSLNLELNLKKTAALYGQDPTMTYKMDVIQQSFECCGISSYLDWNLGRDRKLRNVVLCNLPRSCAESDEEYERLLYKFGCPPYNANATIRGNRNRNKSELPMVYRTGCLYMVYYFQKDYTQFLLVASVVLFFVQITALEEARKASTYLLNPTSISILNDNMRYV